MQGDESAAWSVLHPESGLGDGVYSGRKWSQAAGKAFKEMVLGYLGTVFFKL